MIASATVATAARTDDPTVLAVHDQTFVLSDEQPWPTTATFDAPVKFDGKRPPAVRLGLTMRFEGLEATPAGLFVLTTSFVYGGNGKAFHEHTHDLSGVGMVVTKEVFTDAIKCGCPEEVAQLTTQFEVVNPESAPYRIEVWIGNTTLRPATLDYEPLPYPGLLLATLTVSVAALVWRRGDPHS